LDSGSATFIVFARHPVNNDSMRPYTNDASLAPIRTPATIKVARRG
jgi:hypothetical protein